MGYYPFLNIEWILISSGFVLNEDMQQKALLYISYLCVVITCVDL